MRREVKSFFILCLLALLQSAAAFGYMSTKMKHRSRSSPWLYRFWGSYKSIASVQQLRQSGFFPNKETPSTEQRFRIGGTLSREWFRFEFANEACLNAQVPNEPRFNVPDPLPAPAWNTKTQIYSSNSVSLTNRVDRAFVQLNFNPLELTVGKQVISMGVGRIFSAISQVPRLPFVFVDSEFPLTEDAVTMQWNGPLLLQARFLPRTPGQEGHNFHVRFGERTMKYDLVLTAGQSDDKGFVGFEAARNIHDFVLRGEVIGYEGNQSAIQALAGMDRVFNAQWSGEVEFFYNGFGENNPNQYTLDTSVHRSTPYKGRWYAGTKLTYKPTALVQASLGTVSNLTDPSTLFHLLLNFSISDKIELLVGQYLSWGSHPTSEFGGMQSLSQGLASGLPDLSYLVLRYHF